MAETQTIPELLFRDATKDPEIFYTKWCRRKGAKEWIHMGTPDSHQAEERFLAWAVDPDFEYRLDKRTEAAMSAIVSP